MIRHVILWTLKPELSELEKQRAASNMKEKLESLYGVVDGLLRCSVYIDKMESSTADVMLDSIFENKKALDGYQVHPEHLKVKEYVHSVVCDRKCLDFIVD